MVQEVKYLLRQDSVCDEDIICAIAKVETYEEKRNVRLSKSKAQKEPPCNTSSHKVSEACTVAEHSGKVSSDKAHNSECFVEFRKLVSLLGSLSHQLSSLQKNVCYMKKNKVDTKDDKKIVMKCKGCLKFDNANRCTHSYICGSRSHFEISCR